MTVGEVTEYIDVQSEKEKAKAKEVLISNYNLASMVASFIGNALNGDSIPAIQDLYPDMFKEEAKQEEEKNNKLQTAILKEQLLDFAYEANKRNSNKRQE